MEIEAKDAIAGAKRRDIPSPRPVVDRPTGDVQDFSEFPRSSERANVRGARGFGT